jgi:phytoene dehydrogenase-like protein
VTIEHSVAATADSLGADGRAYRRLFEPFVEGAHALMGGLLAPLGPRQALRLARIGPYAIRSATGLARGLFSEERTRAAFAGAAAHSMVPLEFLATAGYGLGLIVAAHAVGWPVARGGSQRVADALASLLRSMGGEIETGVRVDSLAQLPASRLVLLDVTPRQFIRMAGDRLLPAYRRRLERYRYGPGVFKMDWALNAPVPWRAEGCRRAGTIHLGGTLAEIASSERDAWNGRVCDRPYVLVVQPTVFDPSARPGRPAHALGLLPRAARRHRGHDARDRGSDRALRPRLPRLRRRTPRDGPRRDGAPQREPGRWRHRRRRRAPRAALHAADPERQSLPHRDRGVYLCSSSTPPGVGVHGMCGYYAAQAALASLDIR